MIFLLIYLTIYYLFYIPAYLYLTYMTFLLSTTVSVMEGGGKMNNVNSDAAVVDKAARGGETVLKHLEYSVNSIFQCYFIVFCKNYWVSYGV